MALKDLMTLYGRVALVILAFAFVAAIIAGPVLRKATVSASVNVADSHAPVPELIRVRETLSSEGRN